MNNRVFAGFHGYFLMYRLSRVLDGLVHHRAALTFLASSKPCHSLVIAQCRVSQII